MRTFVKMLLACMIMLAGSHTATAQLGSAYTFPVIAGDSLVTTDTVFKKISITAGYAHMSVQVNIKKATGTLDGKLYLLQSTNNKSYVLTDSATISAVPSNALITNNGAYTHTAIINKASPPGTSYIVYVTQVGSLTASATLWSYTARKHD